ncbi:holo-ACP synthase [Alkalicoccus daliensis]|uniref:Holo-[acyl-carrier-protein] synthase n=1 Tax=Alkalicoccus daliensis TaxID=745820 RepID=A0A1H0ILW5_9BACI|nr:holo-ACP synthase [Alkalicoccus daliensis]SDO32290.1 holo-[acyl-carrier-protein] synthase [Alkalicoccus daliensis]
MIRGIGIDIVELKRIERIAERLSSRILTPAEKETFQRLQGQRKTEFLGGRFAAKEAYAKAAGTGIGKELAFLDIEIFNNEAGKPELSVSGKEELVHVSISHSREYACAQVIIEERL